MSAGAGDAVFDFEQLKGGVESAVQQVVLQVLKGQRFNAGRVSDWTDAITRRGVDALTALSPNFKFIVTATISERCATPVDTASVSFWDGETDGSVTVSWQNDSLLCVVLACGLAM